VQVDVFFNYWWGAFFDMLGSVLGGAGKIDSSSYYLYFQAIFIVLIFNIAFQVIIDFATQHYIFRWRSSMNEYYVENWAKLRSVEGASQRIQEDTKRFAAQVEDLGVNFVKSIMTLIAFLPLLWTLSNKIKEIPFFGSVSGGLVFVSILSASFGTILLAAIGIRLPGLEFRNQRVEAAYRKELVYGEDNETRAERSVLNDLFGNVRKNYFRLFFNYMYFNVAKWTYVQGSAFIPLIAMGPAVVAKAITVGIFQQVMDAFNNVDNSFRFFANSWSDIVELLSIYKRLRAFEASINDQPLGSLETKFIETGDLNA
jgi:peptide/bleomycin uptake transporter